MKFSELAYDCPLREGMQSFYGALFSHELRLELAQRLYDIGVRKIELGSPAAGKKLSRSIREIAASLPGDAERWVHIRCHPADFETVPDNVDAVGLYFGTSDLQMAYSHGKAEEDIIRRAASVASAALQRGLKVRFTAEDATRTPVDRLKRIYCGVVRDAEEQCGRHPQVIGIADTTGAAVPEELSRAIREIRSVLPQDITIEFHGHNDRGFAAANALAAIRAGASSVQVCMLGLGERNGITSLCDLVTNLELDMPAVLGDLNRRQLLDSARWLASELRFAGSYRESLSGHGYFADFAGVHSNGSANNARVYHIIDPAPYGRGLDFPINHPLVGRHAVLHAARMLGLPASGPDDERVLAATARIKEDSFRWYNDEELMTEEAAHGLLREAFAVAPIPQARRRAATPGLRDREDS